MTEEKLLDAMALLPDEMLEETDRLRQKKRIPWKGIAALAACLCLVAGIWLIQPGSKATENAAGTVLDGLTDHSCEKSESSEKTHPQATHIKGHDFSGKEYVDVTVVRVYDGMISVWEGWHEDYAIDGMGELVATAYLEPTLSLSPGQHLRIYFGETLEGYPDMTFGDWVLLPKQIEVFP